MIFLNAGLFMFSTIIIYFLMTNLYRRFPKPILVPIFTSSLIVVCILLLTKTSYTNYMSGAGWIDKLLGPAVVALAIPLYDHRKILKQHAFTIMFSSVVGSLIGMISGIVLSMVSEVKKELILSLTPKSVTTPIALEISQIVGGTPVAAVYVMVAGISGAMFGPYLMKIIRIKHSISTGIGFGTASHGIGTARALEIGNMEGALSSIAMTLSAVSTSLLCPLIISIFY